MLDSLIISDDIEIPMTDIELSAVRSQGAGGQNVNKVASAIHMRFDIQACTALSPKLKDRLLALGDRRITASGLLIIKAQEFRTQERNRRAALDRLREILLSALIEEKPRKKTTLSKRTRKKRVDTKRRRGDLKRARGKIDDDS